MNFHDWLDKVKQRYPQAGRTPDIKPAPATASCSGEAPNPSTSENDEPESELQKKAA